MTKKKKEGVSEEKKRKKEKKTTTRRSRARRPRPLWRFFFFLSLASQTRKKKQTASSRVLFLPLSRAIEFFFPSQTKLLFVSFRLAKGDDVEREGFYLQRSSGFFVDSTTKFFRFSFASSPLADKKRASKKKKKIVPLSIFSSSRPSAKESENGGSTPRSV